jgi:hypothetical protein
MQILDRVLTLLIRMPGGQSLWQKVPLGSVSTRVRYGIWNRPHYAYGVYAAANLAKQLGKPGVTVIEFGVAGGSGLIALQELAKTMSAELDLPIWVVGFDTGQGMPDPIDFRDLPHVWNTGFYSMDVDRLRAQLSGTQLLLGDVGDTVSEFLSNSIRFPIGFIAFDLDYYSSTTKAFRVFEGLPETRLPRVYCYFDDITWPERACHNEYTGELGAIRDFNARSYEKKICPIHLFRNTRPQPETWNDQFYVLHDFSHPSYCTNITPSGDRFRQKPVMS